MFSDCEEGGKGKKDGFIQSQVKRIKVQASSKFKFLQTRFYEVPRLSLQDKRLFSRTRSGSMESSQARITPQPAIISYPHFRSLFLDLRQESRIMAQNGAKIELHAYLSTANHQIIAKSTRCHEIVTSITFQCYNTLLILHPNQYFRFSRFQFKDFLSLSPNILRIIYLQKFTFANKSSLFLHNKRNSKILNYFHVRFLIINGIKKQYTWNFN